MILCKVLLILYFHVISNTINNPFVHALNNKLTIVVIILIDNLFRYANTIADPSKRMQIQKECLMDESGCCKRKTPKPNNAGKSKQSLNDSKKIITSDKKSLSADCQKALKRLASPVTIKKISSQPATSAILANLPSALSVTAPSSIKKFAMGISPPPMGNIKSPSTPRMPYGMGRGGSKAERKRQNNMNMHISNQFMMYNGMMHNNYASPYVNYSNDNVNLSIESLTQVFDFVVNINMYLFNVFYLILYCVLGTGHV